MAEDNNWPSDINEEYQRVRPLGKGAFGLVWLAKAKEHSVHGAPCVPEEAALDPDDDANDDDSVDTFEREDQFDSQHDTSSNKKSIDNPEYVAIKRIHASDDGEKQYAAREIAILSEINHPNVIRCLQSVETPGSRLVVMTLADGPNLQDIATYGGALSISLARLATRHLIAAVSYLHGRGVIHRDIKPENCILTKVNASMHVAPDKDVWKTNDIFWDDNHNFDDKVWKVVLVDFGFAKALTPAEVGKRQSVRTLVQRTIQKQASLHDASNNIRGIAANSKPTMISKGKTKSKFIGRSSSFQRMPIRAMSSVGTRAFAAPEVTKVREKAPNDAALSTHVSDYGLISDAYSVGCTIKVLLTGVPADITDVLGFISSNDNLLLDILSTIFACGKKDKSKRKPRYKFLDETPKPARELVGKLMKTNVEDRLTIPLACEEPWVKGGCSTNDPIVSLPQGDISVDDGGPIVCLKCALH
jgi:serine/threonine protein kinase